MGSRVNIVSVNILDNPAPFTSNFKLEITFEAFEHLPQDLEWEMVYVGSAETSENDQVLDSVFIGPTPEGRHKFVFEADAPNPSKIPDQDIVGVTVLLLKVKYRAQEFINLGWYVSIEYTDPELQETPPSKPQIDKLLRTVKVDDLRVTTFAIKWDENQAEEYPPEQEGVDDEEIVEFAGEEDMEEDEKEEEEECEEEPEGSSNSAGENVSTPTVPLTLSDTKTVETEQAGGDAPLADVTNA